MVPLFCARFLFTALSRKKKILVVYDICVSNIRVCVQSHRSHIYWTLDNDLINNESILRCFSCFGREVTLFVFFFKLSKGYHTFSKKIIIYVYIKNLQSNTCGHLNQKFEIKKRQLPNYSVSSKCYAQVHRYRVS